MTKQPDGDLLFDPGDVEWRPVSLRLIAVRRISAGLGLLPFAIAGGIVAVLVGQAWVWSVSALFLVLFVWAWLIIGRQVRAMGYAERSDDLLIRRGVMFRSLVVVPYGRMQYVDVHVGPLDRAFRVAALQLHTASASTDASLKGLEPDEAARLRDRLASRGEAKLAGL